MSIVKTEIKPFEGMTLTSLEPIDHVHVWPDGTWCYHEDLQDHLSFMSDDYSTFPLYREYCHSDLSFLIDLSIPLTLGDDSGSASDTPTKPKKASVKGL